MVKLSTGVNVKVLTLKNVVVKIMNILSVLKIERPIKINVL